MKLKGLSLFSSAGIAETYYKDIGIDIVIANELIQRRANLYKELYPKSKMIQGSIMDKEVNLKLQREIQKENMVLLRHNLIQLHIFQI